MIRRIHDVTKIIEMSQNRKKQAQMSSYLRDFTPIDTIFLYFYMTKS